VPPDRVVETCSVLSGSSLLAGPFDSAYVTDRRPDALKPFSRLLVIANSNVGWTIGAQRRGLLSGEAAQPRRLALLALLVRAGDRGISRDRLVGYLWPDADEERLAGR
jgi:hypothetical protein